MVYSIVNMHARSLHFYSGMELSFDNFNMADLDCCTVAMPLALMSPKHRRKIIHQA